MRIRTVKPEFFLHEGLFTAERESKLPLRLSFIGLWCAADREGRFKWEPRKLGIQILPYDNADFSRILDTLCKHGFIQRYGDGKFGVIPSFLKHQCINTREAKSVLPEPDSSSMCVHVHAGEDDYLYKGINIQPKLREFIFLRDGGACVRCGSKDDLTVDHIFPQSIGGTHAKQNLRTLCRSCNSGRPVSGQALLDDLAKDGLTLDDMQRMCTHVHAQGEGKGKEGKGREQGTEGNKEESASLPFDSVEFSKAWQEWIEHRNEIKKPLKPTQIKKQLEELAAIGEQRAIAMINHTIMKGWQGLREPNGNGELFHNPRCDEFLETFRDIYQTFTDSNYPERDGDLNALNALLNSLPSLEVSEWKAGLNWCWQTAANDRHADKCVRQTGNLTAFCASWSQIVAYHTTYTPSRK